MWVLSIVSGKGGVGKTTTAIALAAGLAKAGHAVTFIDLDPSGSGTKAAGIDPHVLRPSATIIGLLGTDPLTPARGGEGFAVLGSAPQAENRATEIRSSIVRLSELPGEILVIDTPPGYGALPQAAVMVADAILTPIELEPMAVETLENVFGLLDALDARSLLLGILPTKVSPRLALSALQLRALESYGVPILDGIPRAIGVAEARVAARSVLGYAPKTKAAQAYRGVVNTVLTYLRNIEAQPGVARG